MRADPCRDPANFGVTLLQTRADVRSIAVLAGAGSSDGKPPLRYIPRVGIAKMLGREVNGIGGPIGIGNAASPPARSNVPTELTDQPRSL
jgi:hypothetical protein